MTIQNLKYLSLKAHDQLIEEYKENKHRYIDGDFSDALNTHGWNTELKDIQVDFSEFKKLDASSANSSLDVENSLLVWRALHNLTPTLASDSRVWTRITHAEGFEYTKQRWITIQNLKSDIAIEKSIRKHFFATGRTQFRDDNGISRLWWSAWVAHQISPGDQRSVLEILFNRADTRSNIVERPSITTREPLIQPLIVFIRNNWPLHETELREFMKAVNLYGGGIIFEALSEVRIHNFLKECLSEGIETSNKIRSKNKIKK